MSVDKLNVLLLQSPITLRRDDVASFGFFPPIGLAYLAATLPSQSVRVVIRDLLVDDWQNSVPVSDGRVRIGLGDDDIRGILRGEAPDIVGISNSFTTFSADALRLADLVHESLPEALIVMGGAHATMAPEPILRHGSVDAVVLGEGETTFRELIAAIGRRDLQSAHSLTGTAWLIDDALRHNGYSEPAHDLDALPFPAYHLLPMEKYIQQRRANFAVVMRRPVAHMITTRGCPYNCIFCSTTKCYKVFRKRSPENVLAEMELLIRDYGVREFHFHDDSFASDPAHVRGLCQAIIDRELSVRWQTSQGINSVRLDDGLLKLMQRSGMYRVGFPIESGSPDVLRTIRKPVRLDHVTHLIRKCNELGIYCFGCFMIGFPEETREQLQETLDFIMHSGLDYVKLSITQPLAGSELYGEYERLGLLQGAETSSSTYFHTAFDTVNFTAAELNAARAEAFRAFSRLRLRRMLTPAGLRRFVLPKLRSPESVMYFVKVALLALRGF